MTETEKPAENVELSEIVAGPAESGKQEEASSPDSSGSSAGDSAEIKPGSFRAWMICSRPKTWPISTVPVFVGLAFVLFDCGRVNIPVMLATFLLAILMQAMSNMENDAGYTKRKAEKGNRKGLPRATTNGWLTVAAVERAIKILAIIAVIDTAYMIYAGGWLIFLITAASIIAGYTYMGGPKPTAYTPFGELLVFLFFGIAAVCGTYYLQTESFSVTAFMAACALGLFASGVLAVNNYRDRVHDKSIGRMTLAVTIGERNFLKIYSFLLYAPYAFAAGIMALEPRLWPVVAVFLTLPSAGSLRSVITTREGYDLNAVMFGNVRLEVRFASLLAATTALAAVFWNFIA